MTWRPHQFFAPFSIDIRKTRKVSTAIIDFFEYLLILSGFVAAYIKTGSNALLCVCAILMFCIFFYVNSFLPQTIIYENSYRVEFALNVALTFAMNVLLIGLGYFVVSTLSSLLAVALN